MAAVLVEALSAFFQEVLAYVPPGLGITLAAGFIEKGKYLGSFRQELVGTLLMIVFTFSAGKWIGAASRNVAWIAHAIGVIAADKIGGGPQVNPAVTMAMWALGKITYTDAYVKVAGQMAGGLIAFPLYHAISEALKLEPFGGPEFKMAAGSAHPVEAFLSEYTATLLLCLAIYILNWELNFGKHHYIIKQSLTAVCIRALIECFGTAGPAMNPMLATAWYVFGVGTKNEYPTDGSHYLVYWIAPWMAAVTSAFVWVAYAGGTVFGTRLPMKPIKKSAAPASKKKASSKKKN
jgi:glycerol uptake facilitator-like aquaporin